VPKVRVRRLGPGNRSDRVHASRASRPAGRAPSAPAPPRL